MQLEAFQTARALNKSLRSSVRGVDRATRPTVPLVRPVFRPANSQRSRIDKDSTREYSEAQDNDAGGLQKESQTRRIIRHFDALSKKSIPPASRHSLGVRRHGAAIEKKTLTGVLSRTALTTAAPNIGRVQGAPSTDVSSSEKNTPPLADLTSESQRVSRNDLKLDLGAHSYSLSTPRPADFWGAKSIRHDRTPTLTTPGKRHEDIYLSQARLLQWHVMNKHAEARYHDQEKSVQAQFELVGRSILEKQAKLLSLRQRFEVEKELVELELTLGNQRDQLMDVLAGLQTFKDGYEAFFSALDHESNVLSIPNIDDCSLRQWLDQIHDCRAVLDAWSRDSKENTKLHQGIAQIMKQLCDVVKQEIQEFMQCMTLLTKVREVESLKHSLLASA
ncbi:hypothetical protein BGX34_007963 [Mortierella sp. NVP85]|nr:hypothetical protein BGX34_007963 [Mortierella sp. NVP85]